MSKMLDDLLYISVLPDQLIRNAWSLGEIQFGPLFDPQKQIQPCSVDLTLGDRIMRWKLVDRLSYIDPTTFDMEKEAEGWYETVDMGGVRVDPGELILATTLEKVKLPDYLAARVEGRSTWGRYGIATHVTAGWIDPGFEGNITLEIVNHNPNTILLRRGVRICQIAFYPCTGVEFPYGHERLGSKYQGQNGVTAPKKDRT